MSEYHDNHIFERYEYKYLIDTNTQKDLLEAIQSHLAKDPYGDSTIRNIYYDTKDYRLARISMEKPEYKEKLRLRCYRDVKPSDDVFLEMKKKYLGVTYKRRIVVPVGVAEGFISGLCDLPEKDQISNELRYFKNFYQTIRPAVFLQYDRKAYYDIEDPTLRVTFDSNIQWRQDHLRLTEPLGGRKILQDDEMLMEIKTLKAIPLWLVKELSVRNIRQTSISKYGVAYQTILEESKLEKRKQLCSKYSVQELADSPLRTFSSVSGVPSY